MTLRVDVPAEKIQPRCKCTKTLHGAIVKREMKLTVRIKELIKKTWAIRSSITVEPFVLCYVLPSVLAGLAVQKLCLEKSCLVNLRHSNETCWHIKQGITQNYTEEEKEVQTMVASMTAWSFPLQTALPGLLALFLGAWSDRTGSRKIFMVLPILGKLFSIIGIILSTVFFLQVGMNETAILEGVPPALAGGRVVMTMAVYSYITDITSDSDRTFRLGIVTAILTLARPIGLAISGFTLDKFGYYGVFGVACVLYLIGFVYIVVRLKEKKKEVEELDSDSVVSLVSFTDLVATVHVAFRPREKFRRMQIMLVLLAYMFIVGPVLGEAQMTFWFTRYRFKFNEVDYSLFLAYSVVVGIIGSFITIYLFSKRWQIEDSIIGLVACVSRIAACILYAFASTRSVYFVGPLLDMFSAAGATSLRSIVTKMVDADEVGKASSLISISEALVPVIYSPIYSQVYLRTLPTFSGAFYLISAVLAVPATIIYIALYVLKAKEMQEPKEEEVTRF